MNTSKKNHEYQNVNRIVMRKGIKHIVVAITLLLVSQLVMAQAIQSNFINYQGIARDASGDILVNEAITLDIEIRFGGPTVGATYAETHNVTTDAGGVFNLKIGNGTPTVGTYADTENNWGFLASYVNISLNGTEIGTTEMHAVPFALSAGDRKWFSDNGSDIFYNGGNVGIGEDSPEEELVIGDNLGSGWTVPAATIGDDVGGALQVGNPTTSFSLDASSIFDRARLIATDATGYGQGIIEMRTRQLNIGTAPGVGGNPYALRIVQPAAFGISLVNGTDDTKNWEVFSSVTGNLELYSNGLFVGQFDGASGNYSATSDRRLKTNISPASNVLDRLIHLEAKTYNYKTNLKKEFIGFIAQDVQAQFPEIVTEVADRSGKGDSTLLVDYNQLIVIALKAIKEQQELIEVLKARIEVLENK